MIKTIAANATGVTDGTATGYLQATIDGLLFPITGEANEVIDKKGAQGVAIAYGLGCLVLGSRITRSRLSSDPGAEPVLGFLF